MRKIGLTGGIAAGKSTVLKHWSARSATRVAAIETDVLAHAALRPDSATYQQVIAEFGREILKADSEVDRRALGNLVFADAAQRQRLNDIIHPVVRRGWQRQLQDLAAAGATDVVVVDIPLLYEVDAAAAFDFVVAVGCSETTQLRRLADRQLEADPARQRIRAQLPIQEKLDRADFGIWNDGSLTVLFDQADRIWSAWEETPDAPSKN